MSEKNLLRKNVCNNKLHKKLRKDILQILPILPRTICKVCKKKKKFVWNNDLQKRLMQSNLYQKLCQDLNTKKMSGATISKTISKPVSYYYCCYPATKNYSANAQGDRVRGDGRAAGVGL